MKAFIVRVISAAAIVGILICYNGAVGERGKQDAAQAAGESAGYTDGVYTGEGGGFGGVISVEVEISDGKIADIRILSAQDEDKAYFAMALDVVDAVLAAQTAQVDTVSGATFSSAGIREAVAQALAKAQMP